MVRNHSRVPADLCSGLVRVIDLSSNHDPRIQFHAKASAYGTHCHGVHERDRDLAEENEGSYDPQALARNDLAPSIRMTRAVMPHTAKNLAKARTAAVGKHHDGILALEARPYLISRASNYDNHVFHDTGCNNSLNR